MKLNISKSPQDGRYLFEFNGEKIAVRVSSLPTPYGESFVCRYLPSNKKAAKLEDLGFMGPALEKMLAATKISQGMVLITGPTGSGKSTTLYSMLNLMKTPENKLITLEDPVEFFIPGVTQSQIHEDENYTFLSGLRTILRQDPDIIMLGEIRDLDTADTALQASLTGHVLLSTLHTNSALETVPRLINMGVKPFILSPALHTLVAQRLVRRVCPHCSVKIPTPQTVQAEYQKLAENLGPLATSINFQMPAEIVKTVGCDKCSHTGYSGRLVLCEVVSVTDELKNAILQGFSMQQLYEIARRQGLTTMREDGYNKVALGLTTLEEVDRVTMVQE